MRTMQAHLLLFFMHTLLFLLLMCITQFLYNVAEGQIASCEIDNEPCAATRNTPSETEGVWGR